MIFAGQTLSEKRVQLIIGKLTKLVTKYTETIETKQLGPNAHRCIKK